MEVSEASWRRNNMPGPLAMGDDASQLRALTQKLCQAPDSFLCDSALLGVPTLPLCMAVQFSHTGLTTSQKPLA